MYEYNKAQRVESRARTTQGEVEGCMVPRDPTLSTLFTWLVLLIHPRKRRRLSEITIIMLKAEQL